MLINEIIVENFADGKIKGKSRPGRVKRAGASCDGSVTDLRAKAKKYGGERGKMYHWCANMKGGRTDEAINPDILNPNFRHRQEIGDFIYTAKTSQSKGSFGSGVTFLTIMCFDPGESTTEPVGEAQFEVVEKNGKQWLESHYTGVNKNYRNQQIASTMYAYAKMLGNDIKPSSTLTPQGQRMWAAWKNSRQAKHIMPR